jgi:4-hydroxy-4-methyl-2-oxoglutarate aldolase
MARGPAAKIQIGHGVSMPQLTTELVEALRRLDACRVSNAIETFECRLRNEGFADGSIRALFDDLLPVVGHAVTARIRCSTPPPVGHSYHDRTDWWTYILTVPAPRVVVVEDVDETPGIGAFVGHVHAHILRALGCAAYITNGSVRDLPAVRRIGFQFFARTVSVSHAFVHIVDFGTPVTVGGLQVESGDILYGDGHGFLAIPPAVVGDIPPVATHMLEQEQRVVALCQSPDFSLEKLRTVVRQLG